MKSKPEYPSLRSTPHEKSLEGGIQQGNQLSISEDERLKRALKRHPQRDEPKIDSVEPNELPQP